MSLQRFLSLIDKTPIGAFVDRQQELLEQTDPDRIYVENIRAFFGIPFNVARALCDLAVREHIFVRKIGLSCPTDHRILLVVDSESEIPAKVRCEVCEANERDQYEYNGAELERVVFYKLND